MSAPQRCCRAQVPERQQSRLGGRGGGRGEPSSRPPSRPLLFPPLSPPTKKHTPFPLIPKPPGSNTPNQPARMKGLRKSQTRDALPVPVRCDAKRRREKWRQPTAATTPSSLSYSRRPSLIHSLTHPSIAEQDKALATRAGSRAASE